MAILNQVPGWLRDFFRITFGGDVAQAADVTDITDNSGGSGAAGGTIAAGVGEHWMDIPLDLADIADGDLVTDMTLGFKFKVLDTEFLPTEPVSTAAKTTTLSVDIGTTVVTNSAVVITSAAATPAGKVISSTGAIAANTGGATDTLTVKAASTTAHGEGKGIFRILIQNMDTADAFAVLAAQNAALISALQDANLMAS